MTIDLSIIIVNWNTEKYIIPCIQSIYSKIKKVTFDVWVVDNASQDNSIGSVAKKFPQVNIIRNSKNMGFGYANNQALELSKSKYILFINPDTVIANNKTDLIINFLEENPKVAILGPKILNPDMSWYISYWPLPNIIREFYDRGFIYLLGNRFPFIKRIFYSNPTFIHKTGWVSGSCMFVRRSAIDEVGGFDKDYFLYYEDIDICYRMHKAGQTVVFNPVLEVVHFRRRSRILNKDATYVISKESKLLYYKKRKQRISYLCTKSCFLVINIIRKLVKINY